MHQKYFSSYKNFFINSLKKNQIEIIYIIGNIDRDILSLILDTNCYKQQVVGNIVYKNILLKECIDFQ